MPPPIDVAERLDAIAVATLEIANDQGPRAVTIRAVAAHIGGSTTLITKYLPSRAALLANAFRYLQAQWDDELAAALEGRSGIDSLRALARWSMSTEGFDDAIRRLWLEALSIVDSDHERIHAIRRQAHIDHEEIRAVTEATLSRDADWLTDTLYLAFRGYYLSTIEDPEQWPLDRATAAIERLLDLAEMNTSRPVRRPRTRARSTKT